MTFTLTGRVTSDPRTFAPKDSDQTKLTFGVANNDKRYFDKQANEWKTTPTFFEVDYWTKSPQTWIKRIVKGVPVSVDVKDLWLDKWEGERGSGVTLRVTAISAPQTFSKAERQQEQAPRQEQVVEDYERFEDVVPF